jgi:hypothetical protein
MEPVTGGHAMIALALFQYHAMTFNFVHFAVGLLLLFCVLAILIIGIKWLCSLAGIAIPQPLMVILGIIVFVALLLMLLSWSGLGLW